ncbi:AMP-dependent synthetase and ligase [Nostoc sp. NIES-4103]|nr:AMP-dependent synthetase and ligase [Nostoc sp. NIES-4103]
MSTYSQSWLTEYHFSTLVELLSYRASTQSEQKAYTFLQTSETEAESLTYEAIQLQAQAIAASLQTLNICGERALLLYQPGLDFITAFFGCLYAGVVAVPAYPPRRNQSLSRLQAIAQDAQAKVVLTSTKLLSNLLSSSNQEGLELAGLHWLATDGLSTELAQAWQPPELNSNTLAFLQYTSGSTGTPKGVMITHGNLLHNEQMIQKAFGHTQETIVVGWLPVFHDMGLIGNVLQPLYLGVPCILMSPVDFLQKPIRWLQTISEYKATTSGGPNFAYDVCIRKVTPEQLKSLDLSSWEVAFTGAEPVRAETLEQFASIFAPCGFRKEAFYPCYGMAETTLIVTGGEKTALPITCNVEKAALEQNRIVKRHSTQGDTQTIVGCGGSPLDQQVVIVDPQSLTLCTSEQVGEIWVSGPSVAQGYWNQIEQTKETFNAYLADTGKGPFLRTGDLGFLQDGELFITGRLKDVIIIRGQNHYPQDIELTVEKSHPSLRPGCGAAFVIDFKNSERLVIVQEVERSYLRKLNVQEVVGQIRQTVVAQHALEVFSIVLVKTGSIPKTSSGKIRRRACKDAFLAGTLDVVEDWSENPQNKAKFIHLQADLDSMLEKLTAVRQS